MEAKLYKQFRKLEKIMSWETFLELAYDIAVSRNHHLKCKVIEQLQFEAANNY